MNKINPWTYSLHLAKQLFISGRHLTKHAAFVRPHIELEENPSTVHQNLSSRAWPELPIAHKSLHKKLQEWKGLRSKFPKDQETKNTLWDIEEKEIAHILAIPNQPCSRTPLKDTLLYKHEALKTVPSPIEDDIAYEDHLAKLELHIQADLTSRFIVKEGFFPISGPDFIKSPLHFQLTSNVPLQLRGLKDLYLTGGGSLQSLITSFIKNEIPCFNESDKESLKMLSFGRLYDGHSSFQTRSVASTLLLNRCPNEALRCRDEMVESLKEIFIQDHGISFDICAKGASKLSPFESHSLLFKAKNGTVISELSSFGDYLSKRLNIVYEDGSYAHLTGGTLVDITSLIHSCY